jgi:hypothetical protein
MINENMYLGLRVSLAERLSSEFLRYVDLLRQHRDGAHPVVDLDLLQFIGGMPSRVSAP